MLGFTSVRPRFSGRRLGAVCASIALLTSACATSDSVTPAVPAPTVPAPTVPAPTVPAIEGEVVVVSRGGPLGEAERREVWDTFEARYDVEVIQFEESGTVNASLQQQVDAGKVSWDLVYGEAGPFIALNADGYLSELDYSLCSPAAQEVINAMNPSLKTNFMIAFNMITVNVAYSTKAFPDRESAPKTWADLYNTVDFPGPRALPAGKFFNAETALRADGVAGSDVYPVDFDRALRKLEEVRDSVNVWWTAGAQGPQALADGEAVIALTYAGRVETLISAGAEVDYSWDEAFYFPAFYVIPKGAPNYQAAMAALCHNFEPDIALAYSNATKYPVPSPEIFAQTAFKNTPPAFEDMVYYDFDGFWAQPDAGNPNLAVEAVWGDRWAAWFSS